MPHDVYHDIVYRDVEKEVRNMNETIGRVLDAPKFQRAVKSKTATVVAWFMSWLAVVALSAILFLGIGIGG